MSGDAVQAQLQQALDAGAQIRTFRGRSLAELAPQIRAELGDDVMIVREREGVTGGIAGFFAQRCVEVDVLVQPGAGAPATSTSEPVATPEAAEPPAQTAGHAATSPGRSPSTPRKASAAPQAASHIDITDDAPAGPELLAAVAASRRSAAPHPADVDAADEEQAEQAEQESAPPPVTPSTDFRVMLGQAVQSQAPAAATPAPEPPGFLRRLRELQSELDGFSERLREAPETITGPAPAGLQEQYEQLVAAGLPESIAASVIDDTVTHRRPLEPGRALHELLLDELLTRIDHAPLRGHGGAIVAVVGPPGSGKTRAVARLAAAYTVAAQQPVLCVSVGGSDDDGVLRHALAPFGVELLAAGTPDAAPARLAERRARGAIVLVDTPGLPASAPERASRLADSLTELGADRVLLTAPISHGVSALMRVIEHASPLPIDGLVLTHADETATPGAAIAAAQRSALPLAYLSAGAGRGAVVPADPRRLATMLLSGAPLQAAPVEPPAAPMRPLASPAEPSRGATRIGDAATHDLPIDQRGGA